MNSEKLAAIHEVQNVWSDTPGTLDRQEMDSVLRLFTEVCYVDLADWGVYEGRNEFRGFSKAS